MKIQNTELQGLVEGSELKRRQAMPDGGFGNLLAGCLDGETAAPMVAARPGNAAAVLGTQMALASGEDDEQDQLFASLDSLFATADVYGERLAAGGDLKSAYAALESLNRGIADLKGKADLSTNPELAALVTELDVLATTESIKFNRGDYI